MELLIFSDSHGNADGIRQAIARQPRRPDAVCFLGDGLREVERLELSNTLLYAVRGNCDWSHSDQTPWTERTLYFEGHTILLTHGHLHGVKAGLGGLVSYAASVGADVVLFGHTHRPTERVLPAGTQVGERILERPMYLFNPGSVGYDEDGEGRSFGTLTLQGDAVLFAHGRL